MEDVPSQWTVIRVGRLFRRVKRIGHAGKELLSVYRDHGVVPTSSRDDNHNNPSEDLSPYQLVRVDDLVLNKMKTWQGSIAVSGYEGIVSPAYFVYSPLPRLFELAHPRYVHYLLRNPAYISQYLRRSKGIRVGQWDLDPEEFQLIELLLPTKLEQTQIAAFLDHETAKIDRLIEKQQALISLLKEKRQAVISHAVTKGLNPHAPLKDSGIPWLGQVPAHWVPSSVKYISANVGTGGTPKNERSFTDAAEVPWFTPGDFNDQGELTSASKHITQLACRSGDAKTYPPGSVIVIGIGATLGKVGYSRREFSCNQQINIITPNSKISDTYMMHALSVQVEQMRQLSNASTIGIMNQEKTKLIKIALPPPSEQKLIVEFIGMKSRQFATLLDSASSQITLLQERRTALISAAVTGKIDVRHWQPPAVSTLAEA